MANRKGQTSATRSGDDRQAPIALQQFLTQRRNRRRIGMVALVLIIVALIVVDQNGYLLYRGSDYRHYHDKTFTVTRVVDGDTLHIDMPDGRKSTTVVRLWGIDTPELAKLTDGQVVRPAQAFADQAKKLTTSLCQGGRVRLVLEEHQWRGKYGRLLAHVQLSDQSWLNERLLQQGLAKADDRFSHSRYDRYQALEREARKAKHGLWK